MHLVVHRSGSLPSSFGTPPPVAGRTRGKQPANYRSLRCSPPMPTNKLNAPLPSLHPLLLGGRDFTTGPQPPLLLRKLFTTGEERGAGGRIRKALSDRERHLSGGTTSACLSLPRTFLHFAMFGRRLFHILPAPFFSPSPLSLSSLLIRIAMLIEGSKIVRSSPPPDGQVKIIS